ncbi:hypothetical protein ACIBSW_06720 [Actinoplanes sp. NPDC049668]|uniref:hypothetical protein n=1 Tax=unclassified Actinoplanes TaxID=2626549 RepID=UPI0033AF1844
MTAAQRHWHGYIWTGPGKDLRNEFLRRPGALGTPDRQEFMRSALPPLHLGHYLLRRTATTQDRTWTDPDEAIGWMASTYLQHPPLTGDGGFPAVAGWVPVASDVGVEARRKTSRDALINGVDASWGYWTSTGGAFVSYSAICCPNTHFPEIPCPLPPRT